MIEYDLRHIMSRSGFIATFWAILDERKRTGAPRATKIGVYEDIEAYFEARVGETRFPSYDAFRIYVRRKYPAAKS